MAQALKVDRRRDLKIQQIWKQRHLPGAGQYICYCAMAFLLDPLLYRISKLSEFFLQIADRGGLTEMVPGTCWSLHTLLTCCPRTPATRWMIFWRRPPSFHDDQKRPVSSSFWDCSSKWDSFDAAYVSIVFPVGMATDYAADIGSLVISNPEAMVSAELWHFMTQVKHVGCFYRPASILSTCSCYCESDVSWIGVFVERIRWPPTPRVARTLATPSWSSALLTECFRQIEPGVRTCQNKCNQPFVGALWSTRKWLEIPAFILVTSRYIRWTWISWLNPCILDCRPFSHDFSLSFGSPQSWQQNPYQKWGGMKITLLGTITYPVPKRHFWVDDFPFPVWWDMLVPRRVAILIDLVSIDSLQPWCIKVWMCADHHVHRCRKWLEGSWNQHPWSLPLEPRQQYSSLDRKWNFSDLHIAGCGLWEWIDLW